MTVRCPVESSRGGKIVRVVDSNAKFVLIGLIPASKRGTRSTVVDDRKKETRNDTYADTSEDHLFAVPSTNEHCLLVNSERRVRTVLWRFVESVHCWQWIV